MTKGLISVEMTLSKDEPSEEVERSGEVAFYHKACVRLVSRGTRNDASSRKGVAAVHTDR